MAQPPGLDLRVELVVQGSRCRYRAVLLGAAGHPVVLVADDDAEAPRVGLELRAPGLWADHICEAPFEHWTVGLEAYGVSVAPGTALDVVDPRGELVGFGLDLEWEDRGEARWSSADGEDGYEAPGEVYGEILLGAASLEVAGAPGARRHSWRPGP